jgi:uncharacterized protein (TIGR03437 family)
MISAANRFWFILASVFLLGLAPQARADLITNGNFASVSPALSKNGICTTDRAVYPAVDPGYYPACTANGWTGEYQIGNGATIGYAGVSFGIPQPDPGGGNALILQAEHNLAPSAAQTISIPITGLYTLSFYVANRSSPTGDDGPQTVSVLLDNTVIPGGIYAKLPASWTLETLIFSTTVGTHSLTFEGMDETSGATGANVAAFVDDVSLIPDLPPAITPSGIVPLYSTATTIQPGEFVSIYGTNLGPASPAIWTGNFPTSLGETSVKIDGKAAYLLLVDSTQINLQAPDDTATGTVSVVVTTPNGTATSTVTLGEFGPSLSVLDGKHVAGIILRSDGSGAYGGGTYDIVGPTGTSLGYPTVAGKAGDTLELFGVGFGPTNPVVPAGQVYSGAAATTNSVQLLINSVPVLPAFSGLTSAGLYQLNVVQLPAGLGVGDVPLLATVGGVQTQTGVVISLQ